MKQEEKPCESVELRLLHLESTRRDDGRTVVTFETQQWHVGAKRASVQHMCNTADYSYIRGNKLCELVRANGNPDTPGIEIADDTVAVLEWRYPKAKKTETTRHLAVQESPADITFRVEDWEAPVRAVVQQVLERKKKPSPRQCAAVSRVPETRRRSRDEINKSAAGLLHRTFSDLGMDTDCETSRSCDSPEPSRRSSASSLSSERHGPATTWCTRSLPSRDNDGRGGGQDSEGTVTPLEAPRRRSSSHEDHQIDAISNNCQGPMETESGCEKEAADEVGEMDWAGINIESVRVPQKEDIYWDWSTQEGRWYHRDSNGHIRCWFPETTESSRH